MANKRKKELVSGQYFNWLIGRRANEIYYADGRSNSRDAGRHSLATRDRKEALEQLKRLDIAKAVEFGLIDATVLKSGPESLLTLEEGERLYMAHIRRAPVMGGVERNTVKRYRAVLDKFLRFCRAAGVVHWQGVTKAVVTSYCAYLDDKGYAPATEYLELTTLKQLLKWLVEEKKLPATALFALSLQKPPGTTTYCYNADEVQAMLEYCATRPELLWLGNVLLALTTTGLRINELRQLRWSDFDLETNVLRLEDTRRRVRKTERSKARSTKSHRDRVLPIQPDLGRLLAGMERHADGRVFHGPQGGVLKADTVRNVLIREVLKPLAARFTTPTGEKGFRDGRLHSFRHFFCSICANNGIPEPMLMAWLGHRDSMMVQRYYHVHQSEAQKKMSSIAFPLGTAAHTKQKDSAATEGGTSA